MPFMSAGLAAARIQAIVVDTAANVAEVMAAFGAAVADTGVAAEVQAVEIGRASCRERVFFDV
jgi:hypothetical protein